MFSWETPPAARRQQPAVVCCGRRRSARGWIFDNLGGEKRSEAVSGLREPWQALPRRVRVLVYASSGRGNDKTCRNPRRGMGTAPTAEITWAHGAMLVQWQLIYREFTNPAS